MSRLDEQIPPALAAEVDAALAWYNTGQPERFEVTGILDGEATLAAPHPHTLRLVLCSGEACRQESFRVETRNAGFAVDLTDTPSADGAVETPPAELDPPPGPRRAWLDAALARHAFVVLVFYRGFW